jgi:ABC-2 type transport system ATP-binding protein
MAVALRTEQLGKRYGSTEALAPLDLEVAEGEAFGYLGPNGAGKSTTISLLLGLIRPTGGRAQIFGLDVRADAARLHERLAYVPAGTSLWPSLTGAEALRFLGAIHGRVDETYRDELVERFGLEPDKKIRAYSHGNRQKIPLIAAFASRADLLLLDEPTSGLDPIMEKVFQDCARDAHRRGQTVFLSSHILSEVEAVCERVAMLQRGRIIETGELDVLRSLASVRVEAEMNGTVPDLSAVPGVAEVKVDGQRIECDVTGPIAPLLKILSDAGVERLTTREPSLEELFIARYGDDPALAGVPS